MCLKKQLNRKATKVFCFFFQIKIIAYFGLVGQLNGVVQRVHIYIKTVENQSLHVQFGFLVKFFTYRVVFCDSQFQLNPTFKQKFPKTRWFKNI